MGTTSSSSSSTSASSGGSICPQPCGPGHTCCNGQCVNELNDIHNCGACGHSCVGSIMGHPYCNNGTCMDPPCNGIACPTFNFCCGNSCCNATALCCNGPQGQTPPTCETVGLGGTCNGG